MFLLFGIFRYVKHGKGMLQQHQLLAEFEAAFTEDEKKTLKDGVFEDVLRAAQVNYYSCKPKDRPISLKLVIVLFLWNLGSYSYTSGRRTCHSAKAWSLGICSGECEWVGCRRVECIWIPAIQGTTSKQRVCLFNIWHMNPNNSRLLPTTTIFLLFFLLAVPWIILCSNWTLNHSMPLSLALHSQNPSATACSSWTAISLQSCSSTKKACIPYFNSSARTVTRER